MIRTSLAALSLALLCCALPPAAFAQSSAFEVVVRAPDPLRELLERHLELQRYRAVTDLDEVELARLVVLAERDARELLAAQGYFAPEVRITRQPGERTTLVVEVVPGEPSVVREVEIAFEGDIAGSTEPEAVEQRDLIRGDWGLPAGRPFTQEAWASAKNDALRQLVARRYPAGRISYSLADVDAVARSVQLGLRLDSGPLFRLGEMKISGARRYDPVLVERFARLPPGTVYDQEELVRAQLRLTGSGYYDSAFIFVDPTADPAAAPVQVTVREARMHRLVLGLGFTTDGGPRATAEHTWNRLPRIGWRAQSKLQLEERNPYLQSELTAIPDPHGWRWSVLGRVEQLDDDRLVTRSQRLRAGRFQVGDHIDRNVYLQYERSEVDNPRGVPLTALDTGDGSAVSANYIWTGRYFQDAPFPTDGFGVGFELGGGYTLGGNGKPFQRTVVRGLTYRPLERGRLQLRGELGAVLAPEGARVPATQLFRTGGDTTVRGYEYLEIGVPLPGGLVGPGRYLAVGSVEWQRPLARTGRWADFEGTVFVDAGAVADKVSDLDPRFGVGVGVRWRSPVGPVEAALAYGVKPQRFRLHVTAGFQF